MAKRRGTEKGTDDPRPPRRIKSGDRIWVRCHQIWNILVGQAMFIRKPMEYGELAKAMGYSPKAGITLAYHLGIIGEVCKLDKDMPCLNAIVVGKDGHKPGAGVVTRDRDWKLEQRAVFAFNWHSVCVPTTGTFRRMKEAFDREERL